MRMSGTDGFAAEKIGITLHDDCGDGFPRHFVVIAEGARPHGHGAAIEEI